MNLFGILRNTLVFLTDAPQFTRTPTGGAADVAGATLAAGASATPDSSSSLFSSVWPILMWVGVAVLIYFFMYRQPKKEMKKKQSMRSSIKVGDSVMTNAGLFGKVVEIGTDSFVIEFGTNKGVRVPILKDAVEGVREPKLEPMKDIIDQK